MSGTLTVNSLADTNTSNTVLTLREALLIARGGTGVNGLNRGLSNAEKAQLSGCTSFGGGSGAWTILGGCGGGFADTINFSGLSSFVTITLASSLPLIDDTQPTTIDGTGVYPTIDANVVHANYGLQVTSNGNSLKHIGVSGAWIDDFLISGDNNTLYDVWAWRGDTSGVAISGNYDTIDASRLGVNNAFATSCGPLATNPGNTFNGVYITGAAQHATVKNSYLGCNGSGVTIASLSIVDTYHTIGPNNRIGVNLFGLGNLGNKNNGVSVLNRNNVVMSNTISYNGYDGIEIAGGYGNYNYLGGNTIRFNAKSGIELRAWAAHNIIGQLSAFGAVVSNTISSNLGNGIQISGTATPPSFNIIVGNQIGVSADGLTDEGNGGYGILIFGAHDTYIGGSGAQRNIIAGNALDGLTIAGGAYNTHVSGNLIGVGATGGRIPNGWAGVAVLSSAHDNSIGTPTYGNIIGANQTYGVYIGGSTTYANVVQRNSIGISSTTNISNALDGVIIAAGAHDNWILTNTIAYNRYKGVYLTSGAYNNRLQANTISLQGQTGVVIDGGAALNSVGTGGQALGNTISGNAYDGVYIGGSATGLNAVFGNRIGTNAAGNAAEPNQGNGVYLNDSTSYNLIGDTGNERNIISGNCGDGILLGWGTHNNQILANDIGVNRSVVIANAPAMPAGGGGCVALAGSSDNLAKADSASMTISVQDSSARSSLPTAPTGGSPCGLIGALSASANPAGGGTCLPLPNRYDGIAIIGGFTNTVGGFTLDNYVMFNGGSGIYLNGGTYITNSAKHNLIAHNAVISNTGYGIIVDGGISGTTTYNVISRTLIANNGYDGIGERNGATLNTWSEVSISGNGGLGIDKSASSDSTNVVNPPVLSFSSINKNTGVVSGHAEASPVSVKVELYRVAPDPSGYGEGWSFVGRATADVSGNWTITDPSPGIANGCYTAFVTRSLPLALIPPSSTEFSINTCRTFLPMVLKNY
jgi:hypothetical protein